MRGNNAGTQEAKGKLCKLHTASHERGWDSGSEILGFGSPGYRGRRRVADTGSPRVGRASKIFESNLRTRLQRC